MKESMVEQYLHRRIKSLEGTTRKWTSPNYVGVPDRICFLPGGEIFFVEVKTDKGHLSVRQAHEIEILRGFGATVFVCYGMKGVDQIYEWLIERGYSPTGR